jgi:microsomal dipeptidase-like Zn-dependent dipeptidase
MADMKGGYGRVLWLPTFDAQNQQKDKGPEVKVSENGKLLPSVLALLDYVATRKQIMLETGHISADEALMVIKAAKARGIAHVVATHGMTGPTNLSVPQAQEFARQGGYIEFVYGAVLDSKGKTKLEDYAAWMKAVGPEHCILSTDLGGARAYPRPLPTAGMLEFMQKLHALGLSVADINTMAKTNPARALGLEP